MSFALTVKLWCISIASVLLTSSQYLKVSLAPVLLPSNRDRGWKNRKKMNIKGFVFNCCSTHSCTFVNFSSIPHNRLLLFSFPIPYIFRWDSEGRGLLKVVGKEYVINTTIFLVLFKRFLHGLLFGWKFFLVICQRSYQLISLNLFQG